MSSESAGVANAGAGLGQEFLRVARKELGQACIRVGDCLGRLSPEQIWHRDHAIENSVGNLVLHLGGNVRQWILSGVAGQEDHRDRDWEFANRAPISAAELRSGLAAAVAEADHVLAGLDPATLTDVRDIQVFRNVTVLHAIIHVVTHFCGHTGQIIWATKHLTGRDLGYYSYLTKGSEASPDQTP